jgi:hypothetical protein
MRATCTLKCMQILNSITTSAWVNYSKKLHLICMHILHHMQIFESFTISLGETAHTLTFRQACLAANVLARNVRRTRARQIDRLTMDSSIAEEYVSHQRSMYIEVMQRLWSQILQLMNQDIQLKKQEPVHHDAGDAHSERAEPTHDVVRSDEDVVDTRAGIDSAHAALAEPKDDPVGNADDDKGEVTDTTKRGIDSRQVALAIKALATSRPILDDVSVGIIHTHTSGSGKQQHESQRKARGSGSVGTAVQDMGDGMQQHGKDEYSQLESDVHEAVLLWVLQSSEKEWETPVCVYTLICMRLCTGCEYIHVYMFLCTYVCTYMCACMCVYVCVRA